MQESWKEKSQEEEKQEDLLSSQKDNRYTLFVNTWHNNYLRKAKKRNLFSFFYIIFYK